MSTPTPAQPAAPQPVAKPQLQQISNWVGAAVGTVGNVLPYITPELLVSFGLSAPAVHIASSVAALLLFAYREKHTPVSQPTPEKTP